MIGAAAFTVLWYGVGLLLRVQGLSLPWTDQTGTFLRIRDHVAAPYALEAFKNPPWTVALLLPFSGIAAVSTHAALLVQMFLYWLGLGLVVEKFHRGRGSGLSSYLIALSSPVALDAALNLNLDWFVVYGLLVPPAYSAPLLLVKPQNALGYLLSFDRRTLTRWLVIALLLVIASFAIWGDWPLDWLATSDVRPVGVNVNFAPLTVLSPWIAVPIGAALAVLAIRRRDAVLGILAGTCLVPYIAFYSLLLQFTLIAVRWPRVALIISLALWVIVVIFSMGLSTPPA